MKKGFCRLSAMGMVSALGDSHNVILKRLLDEVPSRLNEGPKLLNERKFGVRNVEVPLTQIPQDLKRYRCRNNELALTAFQQIEEHVATLLESLGDFRMGVVMGTSTSGMLSTEQALAFRKENGHFPQEFDYAQHEMNGLADFIAAYSGITGPAYTISTACSSSASPSSKVSPHFGHLQLISLRSISLSHGMLICSSPRKLLRQGCRFKFYPRHQK